jgi:hypothetical protein
MNQSELNGVATLIPQLAIFDVAQEGQKRLAADFLCIEKSASVTFTSGSGAEPTGFYRLKQIKLPTTQVWQPTEVTGEQYDDLLRGYFSGGQTPSWYWRWGGNILLYPVPSTGSYTVYYYGLPTTTISTSVDPETPSYMDEALIFWTVKELADGAGKKDMIGLYEGKYRAELERLRDVYRRSKTVLLEVEPGPYV